MVFNLELLTQEFIQPEEPKEEVVEAPEVVEEIEEEVVVPVKEAPVQRYEEAKKDAIEYLLGEVADSDREMLEGEDFADLRGVVQKLLDENTSLRNEYENIPAVANNRISKKAIDLYTENQVEWEDEFMDLLGDELTNSKLGKKKGAEFTEYTMNTVNEYMVKRIKAGKKVSNPLLAVQSLLKKKLRELAKPKEEAKVEPKAEAPTPKVVDTKKLASLSTSERQPEVDPRMYNRGMTPAQVRMTNKMNKLIS